MKTAITATLLALGICGAAIAAPVAGHARAASEPVVLVIQGGPENDVFTVRLDPDGRRYTIDSNVSLQVSDTICWSSEEHNAFQLHCRAKAVSGLRISGGEGDDVIDVSPRVPIGVTLNGEAGEDTLEGGAASDMLRGGPGADVLAGNGGWDKLDGNEGDDVLMGDGGDDVLHGGRGEDRLFGGSGNDILGGGPGADLLFGGSGDDNLGGGPGLDVLRGGSGTNTLHQ